MDTIVNQLIGFIVGVVSSWAFWYLMILVKPKILVWHEAVFNPEKNSFLVKVRNVRRRQATDIQASLSVVERKTDKEREGLLLTLHTAQLRKDSLFALAPIQDLLKAWVLRTSYVFVSDDGKIIMDLLREQGDGDRRVVFVISAADGISGTKVVQQVTYKLDDIKYGKFGLGFKIVPASKDDDDDENSAKLLGDGQVPEKESLKTDG
jgi:hypothetical protein